MTQMIFVMVALILSIILFAIALCMVLRPKKEDLIFIETIDEHKLKDVRDMTYEEFSAFITEYDIDPVINCDDFEIYCIGDSYFYYECVPESTSNIFYEAREIAQMAFTEIEDLLVKDIDILSTLFECDICGDYLLGDYIYYSWFRRVGESDV